MDKNEIISHFELSANGIKQLMNDRQYQVSTANLVFNYGDESVSIDNVSFVGFSINNDKVYFDDSKGYEIEKINGSFLISSDPSETIHPLIEGFYGAKAIIEHFGGEI